MPVPHADIVVIGAGHNALTTAAYLADAGLSIVVLEARHTIGGGTVTEELTVPGFKHDTFSTGHPFLLSNPLLASDELGIVKGGLSYVGHDPVLVLPFDDGECVTIWRDNARTAEEFAHFAKSDAGAWLSFLDDWRQMRAEHFARLTNAPDTLPAQTGSEAERAYLALRDKSGLEAVCERFESDHVRAALLWFGMVMVQPIDRPGSGAMPLSVAAEWGQYGWINPIGGSIRLAEALAQAVVAKGGRILTGACVKKIVVEDGRAAGVQLEDGKVIHARRAVVSAIHFTQLPKVLPVSLPVAFSARIRNWRAGPSLVVVHLAIPDGMRVRTRSAAVAAVLSGQATVAGIERNLKAVAAGRLPEEQPWMFFACSSWIDSSRAPKEHATLKLTSMVPYALEGDPSHWNAVKEDYADFMVEEYARLVVGFRPEDALGRFVHAPIDIESTNGSFYRGGPQGGDLLPDQMGANRPVKGWANYRLPVPGLYQTGSSTHPGGTVSGWPGRHAARAILSDLQMGWRHLMPDASAAESLRISVVDTSTL